MKETSWKDKNYKMKSNTKLLKRRMLMIKLKEKLRRLESDKRLS